MIKIAALFLHLRHISFCRLNDIPRFDIALEMLAIPVHNLRRRKANHTDLDRMLCAVTHFDLAIENGVWLNERLVIARARAFFLCIRWPEPLGNPHLPKKSQESLTHS